MLILNKSQMKDAKSMTFATLSVGLYSKNLEIAENAFSLFLQLEADLGIDYEWLLKEGLEILYFCIIKHKSMRPNILRFIEKISIDNPEKIFNELFNVRKLGSQKIYEFISSVLDEINICGNEFQNFLKKKIPEFCFNEKSDICLSCAILVDTWLKLYLSNNRQNNKFLNNEIESENTVINNIIKFLRNAVREKTQRNLQNTAICQMFRLMEKLGDKKDDNAPTIYKSLVFLFLENYDDYRAKEIFLQNFSFIFFSDKSIPIDILLDPYLRQLKGNNNSNNINVVNMSSNYDINDFKFLVSILEHPKIKLYNLKEILEFATLVSYTNLFYSRSANIIINTILDKNLNSYNDLLNSKNLNQDIIDIYDVCISYIKNALKIFLQNSKDYMILETPYDIANLNINYIITNIEKEVIDANEKYRKEKGVFSSGLLSLLWFYEKHDDVLLTLEEKFTEKFFKNEPFFIENIKLSKEKRKVNFIKSGKPTEFLKILKLKREKSLKEREDRNLQLALKEAKFLPESYRKTLVNASAIKNSEQGMSLLESLNLKGHFIKDDKYKIVQEKNILLKSKLKNLNLDSNGDINRRSIQKGNFAATLIQPEGAKIQFVSSRDPLLGKNLPIFYDYENEGEEREKIACEGFLKEFSKHLKQFFNFYVTEINNTVVKHNLMKMFREIGIDNVSLNLDELNSIMRTTFGGVLNLINIEQFEKLIIQLSYVIYSKIKPRLTISMCFKELLKIISYWCKNNKLNAISNESSGGSTNPRNINNPFFLGAYNKKMYKYLKSKVEGPSKLLKKIQLETEIDEAANSNNPSITPINSNSNLDNSNNKNNNDENISKKDILIPPGYKKIIQTEIEYEYLLPREFALNFMNESQLICYEILNEIIKKKFSTGIIEPQVKVYNEIKLLEEPLEPKKRWGNNLTIAFTKLDKEYEKIGKEVADVLEDILRALTLGRVSIDKPKALTDKEKELQDEKELKEKEKIEKEKLLKERKKEIAKRLKALKSEKSLEEKQKQEEEDRENKQKEERLKEMTKKIEQKKAQMKQDVEKSKKEKEKNREEKEKADKASKDMQISQKLKKKKDFFTKQKRKLKEQFKEIKTEKDNYIKHQQDLMSVKLPVVNIQKILDKDKQYIEFEKNLNKNIEELLQRNDLKEFLGSYENHFRHIYDFYSKLGNTKIKLTHEDAIHLNEFKEFCVNFMIYGLLLSSDQITYIFNKLRRRKDDNEKDLFYIKHNEFMISIIYIALFLKISRRGNHRILPSDLDKIDISAIKNLVDFMNLKLPYNKRELEDFINDRRALSAKQLIRLQNQTKKEKTDIKKNSLGSSRNSLGKNKISEILQNEIEEKQKADLLEQMRLKEIEEIDKKRATEESAKNDNKTEEINKSVIKNSKNEYENKKKSELKPNSDKNPDFGKNTKNDATTSSKKQKK